MKSPLWLLGVTLVSLLVVAISIIFFVRPRVLIKAPLTIVPMVLEAASEPVHIDLAQIYTNDLFGSYVEMRAPSPPQPEEIIKLPVPEPTVLTYTPPVQQKIDPVFLAPLGVTVKGVMYSNNEHENSAIVLDNATKKSVLGRVGDRILDAEIIAIEPHKVIFVRSNGQQEVLFVTPSDAQEDPVYSQKNSWDSVVKKISDTSYTIFYDSFVDRIQNLSQLLDMLDVTTAFNKGSIIGCRIGRLSQISIGTSLGLQKGDIIVEIDHMPTATTANRVAIYNKLKTIRDNSIVDVVLIRGGQPLTMHYNVVFLSAYQSDIDVELPTARVENRAVQYHNEQRERDKRTMTQYGGRRALTEQLQQ